MNHRKIRGRSITREIKYSAHSPDVFTEILFKDQHPEPTPNATFLIEILAGIQRITRGKIELFIG